MAQDDFNRVSSKRLQFGATSQNEAREQAREHVENEAVLHPELSAHELAAMLAELTEAELLVTLMGPSLVRLYARWIRGVRQHEHAQKQLALPGFEGLPAEIPTREGKTMTLLDANYRRVRDYYRSLVREYDERMRSDPRVTQARALMKRMERYASEEERITVRQVLLLEGVL